MRLGIIGAMTVEVETLRQNMTNVESVDRAGMTFYQGELEGVPAVVVVCGVGKVNAAMCVQILCDCFGVTHMVNTGIAGSLKAEINIGDMVICSDTLQHDMDATGFGYSVGVIPQMECSTFVADEKLQKLAQECCAVVNPEISTFVGRVVSGDQFISDKAKKQWLTDTFAGYCTEMEGAAIAQAAYRNQVPFLIIRAISDKADDSATMDYPEFEAKAVEHSVNLMMAMAEKLA